MKRIFFDAVLRGDLAYVRRASNFRFSYIETRQTMQHARTISGFSALHYAIYYRDGALFDFLMNAKFAYSELRTQRDVLVRQFYLKFILPRGSGPLSVAVLSTVEIARHLLNIYYTRRMFPQLADNGQSCLHIAAQIVGAPSDLYAQSEFLCYNLVGVYDDRKRNCLMLAAAAGNGYFLNCIAQQCENETVLFKVLEATAQRDESGHDVFDIARYNPVSAVSAALNKLRRYQSLLADEVTVENSDDVAIKTRMRRNAVPGAHLDECFQMHDLLVF